MEQFQVKSLLKISRNASRNEAAGDVSNLAGVTVLP